MPGGCRALTRFDHTDDGFGRISPGFSVDPLQQSMGRQLLADRPAQGNVLSDPADRLGKALRRTGFERVVGDWAAGRGIVKSTRICAGRFCMGFIRSSIDGTRRRLIRWNRLTAPTFLAVARASMSRRLRSGLCIASRRTLSQPCDLTIST